MAVRARDFLDDLDARVDGLLDACTACGECARACPTPGVAGFDIGDPEAVTEGVRQVLRTGVGPQAAELWASSCCGSGACLDVCPHGINPRFMLAMARRAMTVARPADERRAAGKAAFGHMSRGVRVLARLTMATPSLERLSPRSHPERSEVPDVVFYTGCNMLKTPHIGLLCLDVLDRLGVTYEVHGGPGSCCGILQTRAGDMENAARQALSTLDRLAGAGTSQVLSWCPTCQIQFGETMIPGYRDLTGTDLDMTMFPVFLAAHLDGLRDHLVHPVPRRVALYEYAGGLGVMDAVRELLVAVPGLELVETGHASIGYTSTALAPLGSYHRDAIAAGLAAAEAAGVDTLVGVYHADHREFSGHESAWPFAVANYMELIGEAMGINQPDLFKRLKLIGDADAIMATVGPMIGEHGLDAGEVRDVVLADLLGDQHLPTDRTRHGQT